MERTCHSVWLLAGIRGGKECLLFFSFVSNFIHYGQSQNPHSPPRRVLKVKHSLSDTHTKRAVVNFVGNCFSGGHADWAKSQGRFQVSPFTVGIRQTWAASSLMGTTPHYFQPPNGCLKQSRGLLSSSWLGSGTSSLYFGPSSVSVGISVEIRSGGWEAYLSLDSKTWCPIQLPMPFNGFFNMYAPSVAAQRK